MRTISKKSFKSKFEIQFSDVPEGDHSIGLIKSVKAQYLDRNKLSARTIFIIFIDHYRIHDAHSLDLKAIYHLGTVSRQSGNI